MNAHKREKTGGRMIGRPGQEINADAMLEALKRRIGDLEQELLRVNDELEVAAASVVEGKSALDERTRERLAEGDAPTVAAIGLEGYVAPQELRRIVASATRLQEAAAHVKHAMTKTQTALAPFVEIVRDREEVAELNREAAEASRAVEEGDVDGTEPAFDLGSGVVDFRPTIPSFHREGGEV